MKYTDDYNNCVDKNHFVITMVAKGVKQSTAKRHYYRIKTYLKEREDKLESDIQFLPALRKMQLIDMIKYKQKMTRQNLIDHGFDMNHIEKLIELEVVK